MKHREEDYRQYPVNPHDKWVVGFSAIMLVVCLIVSLVQ